MSNSGNEPIWQLSSEQNKTNHLGPGVSQPLLVCPPTSHNIQCLPPEHSINSAKQKQTDAQ